MWQSYGAPPGHWGHYAAPPPGWLPGAQPPALKLPDGYRGDFADYRPDAYHAFERAAVRSTASGVQVGLPNRMCLDKHVPDLLACLPCWLRRNIGDPAQQPWRLQCLDLSRNDLVDESMVHVMGSLRQGGIRLQRLLLAGNRARNAGVHAITEYAWDSPDALRELDLSGNEITVSGELNGNDVVSALLRCFYNHSAYPRRVTPQEWVAGRSVAFDLEPLVLRIGGNFLNDPVRLLSLVCEKGGRERVCLRPGPEVYQPSCEEYLSLRLPDFSRQRGSAASKSPAMAKPVAESEDWAAPDLDDREEREVQQVLAERLALPGSDPLFAGETAEAARWTIAGLALALLKSGKLPGDTVHELEAVMGSAYARPFLEWLVAHLRTLR